MYLRRLNKSCQVSVLIYCNQLRFLGQAVHADPRHNHHRNTTASVTLPLTCRRPCGYPCITWLRGINDNVQPANTGNLAKTQPERKQMIVFLMSDFQRNYAPSSVCWRKTTRRPASADRTERRQFQATGQPVSRMQASDAMTSQLLRYEAKCVQCRCFQCTSVPLRSDIRGTELPPAPLER